MPGDILSEGFEGDGYENTGEWSENVGAGSTVDEDNTDVARPVTGGDQILKIQKVSANYNARTRWNAGSEQVVTYTTFYIRIAALEAGNSKQIMIAQAVNASWQAPWRIYLRRTGDPYLIFRLILYNNGATVIYDYPSPTGDINLDQWYRIDVYYNDTAKEWAWRVDGDVQDSVELTGTLYNPPRYFEAGDDGSSYTATVYYDLYNIDSSGYVSFGVSPGWNKILYTSEPPTPNAWNQVKREAGTGWKKLEYS